MRQWLGTALAILIVFPLQALSDAPLSPLNGSSQTAPPPGDPLSQGLWWLYQLQYERARQLFDGYCRTYPQDPAGYFYKTATDWWQLAQQFDYKLPEIERRLEDDYQDTARVSRAYLETARTPAEKGYACLYWGGAEGLKGRWQVTQKQWVKAYFSGKHGASLLKRSLAYDPTLYDAYLGLGIYDYYTDTFGGLVGALSALLIHGDKTRGMRELQLAIDKSRHARVEAMFFLMEIYTEENQSEQALSLAQALYQEFPASPAMHLAKIMVLYEMKRWGPMTQEAKDYLKKSETETPWYQRQGVQPALYCIGVGLLWGKNDLDGALRCFNEILAQGMDSSRWVTFALLRRGQIFDLRGQREEALQDYRQVGSRPNFWGSHPEARRYLANAFKSGD
ncbi:MAG: tetratricopeptide repeat protein [Elusimicrobiota bacterium]|jgi:tetratricopeptide (TPR) repeat protein